MTEELAQAFMSRAADLVFPHRSSKKVSKARRALWQGYEANFQARETCQGILMTFVDGVASRHDTR